MSKATGHEDANIGTIFKALFGPTRALNRLSEWLKRVNEQLSSTMKNWNTDTPFLSKNEWTDCLFG
jgi:hypothetical protein